MSTVQVKGISSQTSEKEIKDFFSFCGKIQSLSVKPDGSSQSASVTFEKETAAKTALLLDNTQLGPSQVEVTSDSSSTSSNTSTSGKPISQSASETAQSAADTAKSAAADAKDKATDLRDAAANEIAQEDKPRARVAAEMLAHGYVISDQAIQKALALDQQHGVSKQFTTALQNFDAKYHVTEKAQQVDQKYDVTGKGMQAWAGLTSYFEKAAETPTGQKLRSFYEQGSKQVLDVHNEAKHLASMKQGKFEKHPVPGKEGRTECACKANTGKCSCAPGECACSSCAKNPDSGAKTSDVTPEQAEMEKVTIGGQEKTKCNCGGNEGKCPCEAGKCACASCPKSS
ncbi:unnamed protein product [Zymoseptoria tritici ST99CH_1A5]|uniref:RRM domain-containing protein n=1 Tax=Zymoseptoria tritici ST99CH_1A5 TaxID=1276529 RepID=A0A1Y6LEJ1_ZYMTR|nr:unnamed protein product [Zymoseptoria tritici ST99CH_3D1]SMY22745.1 unnamed protein product [Zymoseptoria tritici ST99CH_1A5]